MVIFQFYDFVLQLLYFICNSFGWGLRRGAEEEDRVTRRQHIAPLSGAPLSRVAYSSPGKNRAPRLQTLYTFKRLSPHQLPFIRIRIIGHPATVLPVFGAHLGFKNITADSLLTKCKYEFSPFKINLHGP